MGHRSRCEQGLEIRHVFHSQVLDAETAAHHAGPQGKQQSGQEAENGSKGRAKAMAFIGVSLGKAGQGKVKSLGLASWNSVGGSKL